MAEEAEEAEEDGHGDANEQEHGDANSSACFANQTTKSTVMKSMIQLAQPSPNSAQHGALARFPNQ